MDDQQLLDRLATLEAEVILLGADRIPRVDLASRRRDRRLTLSYFLGVALTLGLAGVGSAAALDGTNTVYTDDIVNGTIRTADIASGQVTGPLLKENAVTSAKVVDGGLTGSDVRDGALSGTDIADGSVGRADIADGSIGADEVADGSLSGRDLNLFNDFQCTGETVQGTAIVNTDRAVPSTFTPDWLGWTHSCSGQQVQVRRVGVGHYEVSFGHSHPARLAVVTPTEAHIIASVWSVDEGVFGVYVEAFYWTEDDGYAHYLTDTSDFSILAY